MNRSAKALQSRRKRFPFFVIPECPCRGSMDPRQGHSGMTKNGNLLRRLWSAFALLFIVMGSLSAARYPQLLRLKGRFTDSKVPLTDNLPVRFSIWDTPDGNGNLLWEDVQNVSVQQDMFQVVLGRVKPLTPSVFRDRKSTRLNSSHQIISYAVFCLKKKNTT